MPFAAATVGYHDSEATSIHIFYTATGESDMTRRSASQLMRRANSELTRRASAINLHCPSPHHWTLPLPSSSSTPHHCCRPSSLPSTTSRSFSSILPPCLWICPTSICHLSCIDYATHPLKSRGRGLTRSHSVTIQQHKHQLSYPSVRHSMCPWQIQQLHRFHGYPKARRWQIALSLPHLPRRCLSHRPCSRGVVWAHIVSSRMACCCLTCAQLSFQLLP